MPPMKDPRTVRQNVAFLLLPEVRGMIREGEGDDLRATLANLHPADVAEIIASLEPEEAAEVFRYLDAERRADTLEHLDEEDQVRLIEQVGVEDVARAVDAMAPDDRADLVKALPEEAAGALLERLDREERRDVQRLVGYPEGTAGSIMSTNYAAVPQDLTAADAIEVLRRMTEEPETVYYIYAVDAGNHLLGLVSLQDLVFAPPGRRVEDLLHRDLITVRPVDDREEVARIIQKYDFLAVPVVDADNRILGIVTEDDILDVFEEEATEDAQLMAAVAPLETPYFHAGFWELVRKRGIWLFVLFVAEMFTGTAMRHFEGLLSGVVSLMFFVPLIISSGGNSGSQSATLITRGLAVGDVGLRDWWRISIRELLVGVTLGILLGVVGLVRALLWGSPSDVCIVVGVTLIAVVGIMTIVGGLLPLALKRLGFDPAIASSPFVASLADVAGVFIYLALASTLIRA